MPMLNIEFSEALKRFGGDLHLLSGTAAIVAEDAPAELKQLEANLESGNVNHSEMSAHTLKGMLSTFAAKDDAVLGLQEIEHAANDRNLTEAKVHFLKSKADIIQLIDKLIAFVESNPAA